MHVHTHCPAERRRPRAEERLSVEGATACCNQRNELLILNQELWKTTPAWLHPAGVQTKSMWPEVERVGTLTSLCGTVQFGHQLLPLLLSLSIRPCLHRPAMREKHPRSDCRRTRYRSPRLGLSLQCTVKLNGVACAEMKCGRR